MCGHRQLLWEGFLALLGELGTAVEAGPGRVRFTVTGPDGAERDVDVLISPEQCDEMISVMWGGLCPEFSQHLAKIVRGLEQRHRFLVYDCYTLVPSESEDLPVDEDLVRLQAQAREHPEGIGRWVVEDRDGNVVDEFARHLE